MQNHTALIRLFVGQVSKMKTTIRTMRFALDKEDIESVLLHIHEPLELSDGFNSYCQGLVPVNFCH